MKSLFRCLGLLRNLWWAVGCSRLVFCVGGREAKEEVVMSMVRAAVCELVLVDIFRCQEYSVTRSGADVLLGCC